MRANADIAAVLASLLWGFWPNLTFAQSERSVAEVANGVHVFQHRTEPFEGGNTTLIVGDRAAMVIDSGFIPYATHEDIAEIRALTGKPVRYVLNTHWHNDHVMGNQAYAEAYPGVAFIAHRETRRDMDLNIPNAPGRSLPSFHDAVEETEAALRSGIDTDGEPLSSSARTRLAGYLERLRAAAAGYESLVYQPPTLTFERALIIDLGNREVRIEHLGRGNTNGDSIAWLADERVVIVGDLLVSPLPYVYDGYPGEWIETLERLRRFDARRIVPGHGPVMPDWSYLDLVRDLLASAVQQVDARLHVIGPAEFRSVDEVIDYVDLTPFRDRFAGNDAEVAAAFDQTAERLVRLVFKEASQR